MHRRAILSAAFLLIAVTAGCSSDDGLTSTWLGTGEASPTTVEIYTLGRFKPQVDALIEAYEEEHTAVDFVVRSDRGPELLDDILDGDFPDIYIDDRQRTREVERDERVLRRPTSVGSDQVLLLVSEERGADIVGLTDFGPESPLRLGICEAGSLCGTTGTQALVEAGVQPANPVLLANQGALVDALLAGEVDGVLVLQSGVPGRTDEDVRNIRLPAAVAQRTDIDGVQLGTNLAAQDFLRWIQTSSVADAVLTERGYRSEFFGRL